MTYPTQFSERQHALLSPIISQIESGSEEIEIKHQSAALVSELRHLIYAYLSPMHSNLKSLFVLKQLSPTRLILRRRSIDAPIVTTSADPSAEFFKDYLLEIESESEAIRLAEQYEPDRALRLSHLEYWRARQ
jgi:hypothetical protein